MYDKSKNIVSERGKYLFPALDFLTPVIERGEGSYVISIDGDKILDLNSGQYGNILGCSNKEINEKIYEQIRKIAHTSTACLSDVILSAAEKMNFICSGFNAQTLLLSTGSEAVETALRYSKYSKNKNGVICLDKGYHGLSLGSQSVTHGGIYARPSVKNVYSVPTPHSSEDSENSSLEIAKDILQKYHNKISAFILEPIVSVGGMVFLSQHFLQGIRKLCHDFSLYLIIDECQTGYGRTGSWFAYEKMGVIPDILICAKGLGLGFPVSAVIFNANSFDYSDIVISNYSSHQNDPFAASIILIGIDYINDNDILTQVQDTGKYFLEKLKEIEKAKQSITSCRGSGLMLGFDLKTDTKNYRAISKIIIQSLLNEGIMIQTTSQGKTFRILPDYLIRKTDIDFFVNKLLYTLEKVGLV